ncbi:MAG TPA: hypothetical protein QGF58_16285 [Myxococcota bacterium]|nr:hypothetical protein [Myxococcota bacterium]
MGLDKLSRLSLTAVARELAIHPFDLIRILVAEKRLPETLRFEPGDVETIRRIGSIETWWTEETARCEDDVAERGLLRDLSAQLVERGIVGLNSTRLDNVLRGLETGEQLVVRALVQQMVSMGQLKSRHTPRGLHVSVVEGREYAVADLAEGGDVPTELAEIWA